MEGPVEALFTEAGPSRICADWDMLSPVWKTLMASATDSFLFLKEIVNAVVELQTRTRRIAWTKG
jgi:hypothetical protein